MDDYLLNFCRCFDCTGAELKKNVLFPKVKDLPYC